MSDHQNVSLFDERTESKEKLLEDAEDDDLGMLLEKHRPSSRVPLNSVAKQRTKLAHFVSQRRPQFFSRLSSSLRHCQHKLSTSNNLSEPAQPLPLHYQQKKMKKRTKYDLLKRDNLNIPIRNSAGRYLKQLREPGSGRALLLADIDDYDSKHYNHDNKGDLDDEREREDEIINDDEDEEDCDSIFDGLTFSKVSNRELNEQLRRDGFNIDQHLSDTDDLDLYPPRSLRSQRSSCWPRARCCAAIGCCVS